MREGVVMDFAELAPLIKEERALRKAHQDRQFEAEAARRFTPDDSEKITAADEAAREANDAWVSHWEATREEVSKFLEPFGLTRMDLIGVVP
jgi:cytosine/adenosine deaminase-related metal-dependent hydrolase